MVTDADIRGRIYYNRLLCRGGLSLIAALKGMDVVVENWAWSIPIVSREALPYTITTVTLQKNSPKLQRCEETVT
jgi:hypothetical protein